MRDLQRYCVTATPFLWLLSTTPPVIILPMPLTLIEVKHIAQLARLELSEDELSRFQRQLSDILDYAGRLQALDTAGIPPTASVLPARSLLRPDEPGIPLTPAELLANAPCRKDDQFRVPPVFEGEP